MGSPASGQDEPNPVLSLAIRERKLDEAILLARDYPFCSRRSSRGYESFISQIIFRDSKKIFCDFSVGIELEN